MLVAGVGAASCRGGRVMAAGAGWAWVSGTGMPVHVTGPAGPRGPLTAVIADMPLIAPGDRMHLDTSHARIWHTPPPARLAPVREMRAACDAVRAHGWPDPRALALGRTPDAEAVPALIGRGPGLTPAGDDVLVGYLIARGAMRPGEHRTLATLVLRAARHGTGGPARAFLRMAARGECMDRVAAMRDALLTADGPTLASAVRELEALGRTTGRATLTGLVAGLTVPA